jgi:methylenetetrahydrofolate reductase (NADPH)
MEERRHPAARFEVMPFGDVASEAGRLPQPIRIAITCSPKLGPDRSVEMAAQLGRLGHATSVHLAARMVRDRAHLDGLLSGLHQAGTDDLFLIGGDIEEPLGEFSSAGELLPLLGDHPQRPARIGIAGYPEGHPKVDDAELDRALRQKSERADYVVTQMCFDVDALATWIARQRAAGLELPVLIGLPGKVARRKLVAMAARVGVGPSVDFLRKQSGLRRLFSRRSTADRLYEEIGERELGIDGFQFFTFNELLATWEWHQKQLASNARTSRQRGVERDGTQQPAGAARGN